MAKPPTARARLAWGLSGAATLVWLVAVVIGGWVGRVIANWESAATMLFGSFLGGSSPLGGGAVSFPVFTKALHVPGSVARTFGLLIQSVGMTMAVVAILLFRRTIHLRAAVVGSIMGTIGFVVAVALWGQPDQLFWPSSIATPWVKATFSIVLATTSVLMVLHSRHTPGDHVPLVWTRRFEVGLALAAFAGGVLSSLAGTGANILVFLFLVVLADVNPKVALPTAIVVMAAVSVVGLVVFGIIDGQLDVDVVGDRVVAVGGQPADLPADRADLLGLWLAAVPVVVWAAPLGSLVASRVSERFLVGFVAVLAAVEVMTTVVLVPELRTEWGLALYLAFGLALFPCCTLLLRRNRQRVFRTRSSAKPFSVGATLD